MTSTVKFIVILCILWYIINFRFPAIHGWESLIVVNFYDCNYQNVNMYHRIAITFYSHVSCSYADIRTVYSIKTETYYARTHARTCKLVRP